jgi:hypothetical protein
MLAITGHWIDKAWVLHEALLAFTLLEGSHTGNKLAKEIFKTLDGFNIAEKLFCITTDNASNNTKAMRMLAKLLLRHKGIIWEWEENHISCLNHVINIAVQAFLKKINCLDKPDEEENDDEEEEEEEESDDDDDEEEENEDENEDGDGLIEDDVEEDPIVVNFGMIIKKLHTLMKVICVTYIWIKYYTI